MHVDVTKVALSRHVRAGAALPALAPCHDPRSDLVRTRVKKGVAFDTRRSDRAACSDPHEWNPPSGRTATILVGHLRRDRFSHGSERSRRQHLRGAVFPPPGTRAECPRSCMAQSLQVNPRYQSNNERIHSLLPLLQLVLLNVSDQVTRAGLNGGEASTSACRGVLLGQQHGMRLSVTNSFELPGGRAKTPSLCKSASSNVGGGPVEWWGAGWGICCELDRMAAVGPSDLSSTGLCSMLLGNSRVSHGSVATNSQVMWVNS